jgi:hypothetical protein
MTGQTLCTRFGAGITIRAVEVISFWFGFCKHVFYTGFMRFLSLRSALLTLVMMGCGGPPPYTFDLDSGGGGRPDAVCNPSGVMTDLYNCGSCGAPCQLSRSDRCVAGLCRCGNEGPCEELSAECRFGRCVTPDPGTPCESSTMCTGRRTCVDRMCLEVCEFDEQCAAGYGCVGGRCTFLNCVDEVCDGVDNNCNGMIDESPSGGPLARYCDSGEIGWEGLTLPCRRGTQVCRNTGRWSECLDETRPVTEQGRLACDLVDNDCDGCVDGTFDLGGMCVPAVPNVFDVVFLVDLSGSMGPEIRTVQEAVRLFSRAITGPDVRFAFVAVPGRTVDGVAEIELDFVDFTRFETFLATVTPNGSGVEPTYDVVYEVATDELFLSWAPGSTRIMILFTDETAQSWRLFLSRGTAINEEIMCASLTHGEVFVVVTDLPYFDGWDLCATLFPMSTDATEIANRLQSVIGDPCTSR